MDLLSGKKIHEGKFSIVYLVEHKGEKFIVKQLHPRIAHHAEWVSQFRKEAQLPDFTGINPRTLDYKEYIGGYFIVREYIPGITLKQIHTRFTRKKYHPLYRAIYLQLCDQLSALHSKGIIHGDIKPSNILFTTDNFENQTGEIRLLDLGLSVQKEQLPIKQKDKPLHFSMMYGAPELMLNEPSFITEATDLFSMGICMYQSFSGDAPYKENHPAILLQMMLSVPLKKRRKIPGELFGLIQTICKKPLFKKPIAFYTIDEVQGFLKANIEQRSVIPTAHTLRSNLESIF